MGYLDNKPIESLTPEEARVKPWFAIDGDKSLRVDYELNSTSLVYDIGGYEGKWTESINKLYKCRVEVFEPVQEFVKILEAKFKDAKKINIHPFGLSGRTREVKINLEKASSSTFKSGKAAEKIKLVAASEILNRSSKVDLMKINIEGGEYELLENLITHKLIANIVNVQVQFHIFVPNAHKKRVALHEKLSRTHDLTYCYPWIWENWRLKK
jgi:FkbM family methyltransferase